MEKKSEGKYTTIHYHSYLELDKVLGAQILRSEKVGKPAHEEMLFIITHQAYELWFKQINHEVKSVVDKFSKNEVDERSLSTAIGRLDRVEKILALLIKQIGVLETMTPLDPTSSLLLDFRVFSLEHSSACWVCLSSSG